MYSSMTETNVDYSGWGSTASNLDTIRVEAMKQHVFASSVRTPGTIITTKIYRNCETCGGSGRVSKTTKKRVSWRECDVCCGEGLAALIETITTTIELEA